MPNTHTAVQVTQEDREAAANLWIYVDGDTPTPAILNEAERYRQGVYDHTPAVQAFARHRVASTRTVDTELLEALKVQNAALVEAKREMWLAARSQWTLADFKNWAVIQQIDGALSDARAAITKAEAGS